MADVFMKNYACLGIFGRSPRLPNYARVIAHGRDTYWFKKGSGNYKFFTKEVLSGRFNGAGTWTKDVQFVFLFCFVLFWHPFCQQQLILSAAVVWIQA